MAGTTKNSTLTIAFMNIRGQTGLNISKQIQIENFIKSYKVDILNCQEINISDETFSTCNLISSQYDIISNNAENKYGTCCLVSNNLVAENIKCDTNGREIAFNIGQITFCNVYLPSGNDPVMRNSRETYSAEIIPQVLINSKDLGCVGGDWNSIIDEKDATKNPSSKKSNSLKRLVKNFSWRDSFREIHPDSKQFSRYYDNSLHGEGATRLDRMYHYGQLRIIQAFYVGVAFSDHFSLIVKIKLPENMTKYSSPKYRPLFKSKPDIIDDELFQMRLKENVELWKNVRDQTSLKTLDWWELIVKPNIKKLLIERGREVSREKFGTLNMLLVRQAFLVKKVQEGMLHHLAQLRFVQGEIVRWHNQECEKVKMQARCEEIDSVENVRIYHHELHKRHIVRSSILKLETGEATYEGHSECANFLENQVGQLLSQPAALDPLAKQELLSEVQEVFTSKDNTMITKAPTLGEVKNSVSTSNLQAAPGTDGITSYFYKSCWNIIGQTLTDVVQAIHSGQPPTLSQRTSLMVFGCKPKKPKSTKPGDKRKISLLNSDFKITTGILNERLKKVATHTLSPCQLAVGDDRRIHHGINQARDAIQIAGVGREGVGILDNDYQSAFDLMVLRWVLDVLRAKGLAEEAIKHIENLYSENITVVVVNNVPGRKFKNNRWSIRQGDRPSCILFCYGIDPHLDWLDRRLSGIPIYRMPAAGPVMRGDSFPLTVSEIYRVAGYVDDVKPAITNMSEFSLVDHGSSVFEAASGCTLHRDPSSGKVKFLPLGRWRGTLCQEDIPVNYILLSDHLDMIGVVLKATHNQTRKANGDNLVSRVKNIIGAWKGGKFMELSLRSQSVNTYCLSKVWFKSASIDLRVMDSNQMLSSIKSWIYADLLIKPEELVLYRSRQQGGLGLMNVKYRAMAELIKSFLDTAINPKFKRNLFHHALYWWHIEDDRDIPDPGKPPYFSDDLFAAIKAAKSEGLRPSSMTVGMWYRFLMEEKVIQEKDENGFSFPIQMKAEKLSPNNNWEVIWPLIILPGLDSRTRSFLLKLLHNLLPTQERLHRVLPNKVLSPTCSLCPQATCGDQLHSLILCPFNNGVGLWLYRCIRQLFPDLESTQLISLNFETNHISEKAFPAIWMIAKTLLIIWASRTSNTVNTITITRASLEAEIMLLRKTRFRSHADGLKNLITL